MTEQPPCLVGLSYDDKYWRKECVKRVWPIRSLFSNTESLSWRWRACVTALRWHAARMSSVITTQHRASYSTRRVNVDVKF